jgi:hypothetical protein
MTQTWDCSDARLSLGVYVLGAIDPAERQPAWRACPRGWPG